MSDVKMTFQQAGDTPILPPAPSDVASIQGGEEAQSRRRAMIQPGTGPLLPVPSAAPQPPGPSCEEQEGHLRKAGLIP